MLVGWDGGEHSTAQALIHAYAALAGAPRQAFPDLCIRSLRASTTDFFSSLFSLPSRAVASAPSSPSSPPSPFVSLCFLACFWPVTLRVSGVPILPAHFFASCRRPRSLPAYPLLNKTRQFSPPRLGPSSSAQLASIPLSLRSRYFAFPWPLPRLFNFFPSRAAPCEVVAPGYLSLFKHRYSL